MYRPRNNHTDIGDYRNNTDTYVGPPQEDQYEHCPFHSEVDTELPKPSAPLILVGNPPSFGSQGPGHQIYYKKIFKSKYIYAYDKS